MIQVLLLAQAALAWDVHFQEAAIYVDGLEASVTGAPPGVTATVYASISGKGLTCSPGGCLDLLAPKRLRRGKVDADGNFSMTILPPESFFTGTNVWLQVVVDGEASDVGLTVLRADFDGDGYGAKGLDCNDADGAIHPDAFDTPRDGIDQNCDGEDAAIHWSYDGETGPEFWGSLHEDFATCDAGLEQSPIDVPAGTGDPSPIDLTGCSTTLFAEHNGHTVEYDVDGDCELRHKGGQYNVLQFHFHSPSEHKIAGAGTDMEMHIVHQLKGAKGLDDLLVVGVLYKAGATPSSFLDGIGFDALPSLESPIVENPDISLNPYDAFLLDGLGDSRAIYDGSLTTPTCAKSVTWHVLTESREMSFDQLEALQSVVPFNARDTQPLYEREVEHVGP